MNAQYCFAVDLEGNPIMENGKYLICDKSDPTRMFFMEQPETAPATTDTGEVPDYFSEGASSSTASEPSRTSWSRNDILKLIALYEDHREDFKSHTIKNERVWHNIAEKLKSHSADQCRYKFKYLKSKYCEVKDSQSGRRTGEKKIKFEYFNELDDLFHDDHNVEPLCIASSLKGKDNLENIIDEKLETVNPKKKKKSILEKQLDKFESSKEEREQARQKRHEELMERQDRAIAIFQKLADAVTKSVETK